MSRKRERRGIAWPVTIFLVLMITAVLWWRGHDYYPLSLYDRVDHPDYRQLRSSGNIGYGYGVAGVLLVFTNLLYLARRRFARWNMGSMKTWLDLHVFTGLAGAAFISFHSTFKARSALSMVTSVSLLVVVITGLIGRFLYALVPRREEKRLSHAIESLDECAPGMAQQVEGVVSSHSPAQVKSGSLIRALMTIPSWRRTARDRCEAVDLLIANADTESLEELALRGKNVRRELARDVRAVGAAALLRSWRSMHRFFAILMLLSVISHIGVAIYFGYWWYWSQ
jgi:hypothetical protein